MIIGCRKILPHGGHFSLPVGSKKAPEDDERMPAPFWGKEGTFRWTPHPEFSDTPATTKSSPILDIFFRS